jgi:hypothetical protein
MCSTSFDCPITYPSQNGFVADLNAHDVATLRVENLVVRALGGTNEPATPGHRATGAGIVSEGARLCRSGERCTVRVHAFLRPPPPRWAFSSPGPCPHQGSSPQKSGSCDHVPSLRTTCRIAATSPRTIPRNAGAQINRAAGHAVIWSGTLGVRCDAQGAHDGEFSVPLQRWPVCAIDRTLKNEPTAVACAWFSTGLENLRVEQTSFTPLAQSVPVVRGVSLREALSNDLWEIV